MIISNPAIDLLLEHSNECGQITWREASLIAAAFDRWSEYVEAYAPLLVSGCGVDTGEFIFWLQQ